MRKTLLVFTILLLYTCTPEPIWGDLNGRNYTNITVEFSNDIPDNVELEILKTAEFLEVMVNSQMFEDFVLGGNYTNNQNELNLSNKELYEYMKQDDWHFIINYRGDTVSGNRVMSQTGDTTNVRSWILNYRLAENTAVLAHEYMHKIGIHHRPENGSTYASFQSYLQFEGEKLFAEYQDLGLKPEKNKFLQ